MAEKFMKIRVAACISAIMACAGIFAAAQIKTAIADGRAEIAMEMSRETVLCENNADVPMPMASTTKIMTAMIIIEDCDPDEIITVPDEAVGAEGSSVYLKHGEQISVKDLLYGLMLRSGNDCAAALAIHHSGSIQKFACVMNERAKKLGATNTNFTNPSGLPDDNHYTTARDLCKIACRAMSDSRFKEIVSCKNYSGDFRSFVNKNKMLFNYGGANGVKTGYTRKAGRCLVSSAERDGMTVVCVVLDCSDMYERSAQILDSCFSGYKLGKIDENTVFMSHKVLCKLNKTVNFVTKNGVDPQFKVIPLENLRKIKAGDKVAELEIYCENSLILRENLYSINSR